VLGWWQCPAGAGGGSWALHAAPLTARLASYSWLPVPDPAGVCFLFAFFVLYIFWVYFMFDVPRSILPTQV
jgi:hypothetical protein